MGKSGKKVKKENESLICKQDILNDELRQLEKCNSEFLEDFKKFGEDSNTTLSN